MTAQNLFSIVLETSVFAIFAAALSLLFRLRIPKLRLAYWQQVLALMLLVPAGQFAFRQSTPVMTSVIFRLSTVAVGGTGSSATDFVRYPWPILIGGIVLRAAWLIVGIVRLSRFRRRGLLLQKIRVGNIQAEVRLCPEVPSPVSFGLLRPVILVPDAWPCFAPEIQHAVLAHEQSHLQRRDWPMHLFEELLLAGLWFHPAVHFVISKICMEREQVVDAGVVACTQQKDSYIRALLLNSGRGLRTTQSRTAERL